MEYFRQIIRVSLLPQKNCIKNVVHAKKVNEERYIAKMHTTAKMALAPTVSELLIVKLSYLQIKFKQKHLLSEEGMLL